jgi:hypothetical protein
MILSYGKILRDGSEEEGILSSLNRSNKGVKKRHFRSETNL